MDKDRQIEEMAKDLCECYATSDCNTDECACYRHCNVYGDCSVLFAKGYRKQNEVELVIENHGDGICFGYCPNCGARYEASNASVLKLHYRYCNYCGAKIKGGAE